MGLFRERQVERMLDAYKGQRKEGLAGRPQSRAARQAGARLDSIRRASTPAERAEFVDRSLDEALGRGWRRS